MFLSTYFGATALVCVSVLVSVLGVVLVRKFIHIDKLRPSHDVGGYLISVAAALYSVLLGLIVVDAMQFHQRARELTVQESNNLTDVFILAKCLPEPRRSFIRLTCSNYAQRVIDTEWGLLQSGNSCPQAGDLAIGLMQSLADFEPKTENEKALYPQIVEEAREFWQNRQARLNIAQLGIPAAEWVALVAGAVVIIAFSFLFGIESFWIQLAMTSMVSFLLSMSLSLLLLFSMPFKGDLAVQSAAFNTIYFIKTQSETTNR